LNKAGSGKEVPRINVSKKKDMQERSKKIELITRKSRFDYPHLSWH
jgi:hypothetical protein